MRIPYLFFFLLLLTACRPASQKESADHTALPPPSTIRMDTTDAALLPLQQAVEAFEAGEYRKSTDFIMEGIEKMKNVEMTASDTFDLRGFRQSIQELTLGAARISRYEIANDQETLNHEFARARLEMTNLLLEATKIQGQALVILPERLHFCLRTLEASTPYFPGQTNQELQPLLREGRQLLESSPTTEQLSAFLLKTLQFVEAHKAEIAD